MIFPKPLKKGDTIGVIAPSSPVDDLNTDACVKSLNDLGYKAKLGISIGEKHGFLSGTDETRARDFNDMFGDKEVDGIICLRGGYGSARILPMIDWELPKKYPKFFMGFSDITALHVCLNQKSNLITFHGPMVNSTFLDKMDDHTLNSFMDTMNGLNKFRNPPSRELVTVQGGRSTGQLVGGNLTLLGSMMGTPYEVNAEDKILVIEDVGKEPFRLDRILTQMKQAGKLSSLKGILVGDFKNCEPEKENTQGLDDLIIDHFVPLNIPIIKNLGVGHCNPMSTLPLGAICHMDADERSITFE